MFCDEWVVEVVGFYVDDLELFEGDWEHGEDLVVEEAEVGSDKVVFVDGTGVLGFGD